MTYNCLNLLFKDIRRLTERLLAQEFVDVITDEPVSTDLFKALRGIRAEYKQLTLNNKIEVEGYHKSKVCEYLLHTA